MKISQQSFFATFVFAALTFSQAEANEEPRFVVEGGLDKEIVDRKPSTTESTITVQVPESSIHRGIETNEAGLPIPEDTQLQTESNGSSWLPDPNQNQDNLVISRDNMSPGTIRGGGLTTRENLTPVDQENLEPSARSMDSFRGTQNTESSLNFSPDPDQHPTNLVIAASDTSPRPGGLTSGSFQSIDEQAQSIQVEASDQDTVSRTPDLTIEQPDLNDLGSTSSEQALTPSSSTQEQPDYSHLTGPSVSSGVGIGITAIVIAIFFQAVLITIIQTKKRKKDLESCDDSSTREVDMGDDSS